MAFLGKRINRFGPGNASGVQRRIMVQCTNDATECQNAKCQKEKKQFIIFTKY